MIRVAAIVWMMLGIVFAGSAVMSVLLVPELADNAMRYIPMAGVGGFVAAIPFALLLGRRLSRSSAEKSR
jgi:hypothetical protein